MQQSNLLRLMTRGAAITAAPFLLALAVHAQEAPTAPADVPAKKAGSAPNAGPDSAAKAQPAGAQVSPSAGGAAIEAPNKASKAANAGNDQLLGLEVVGSDGKMVGQVQAVKTEADGKIVEIHVKTGSTAGLAGKTVAIPVEKFTKSGANIKLSMSSTEIRKLPTIPSDRG